MDHRRPRHIDQRIREWQRMRTEFGAQAPLPLQHFIDREIEKLRALGPDDPPKPQ